MWDNAELLEDLLHGDELSLLDSVDSWGRTALHAASTTENSRCLRILLQAGGMVMYYIAECIGLKYHIILALIFQP